MQSSRQPAVALVRDPRKPAGGFETWVENLAVALPREGIAVHLLVPGEAEAAEGIRARFPAVDVRAFPAADAVPLQARHLVEALADLARTGASGVFFTMSYPYINVAGGNLRSSPWVPIPVMHGRHASNFDWMCLGPPRRIVSPSGDFAAVCRRELARRIGRLRALGSVVTIPHGVPLPGHDALEAKSARPVGSPLRLVAVSRLHAEAKRPFDYLAIADELMRRRVSFELSVLGEGPCLAPMRERVAESGLGATVALRGAADRETVQRALLAADVMLATSETEAFGLSLAEALACGCAVVTTDLPGAIAEMVPQGVTGYRVGIGDIAGFADRVAELAGSQTARKMGEAGHRLIAARFSLGAMARAYASLIRAVAPRLSDPRWKPPAALALTPGEAVGPGLAARLGIGWLVRGVRRQGRAR